MCVCVNFSREKDSISLIIRETWWEWQVASSRQPRLWNKHLSKTWKKCVCCQIETLTGSISVKHCPVLLFRNDIVYTVSRQLVESNHCVWKSQTVVKWYWDGLIHKAGKTAEVIQGDDSLLETFITLLCSCHQKKKKF